MFVIQFGHVVQQYNYVDHFGYVSIVSIGYFSFRHLQDRPKYGGHFGHAQYNLCWSLSPICWLHRTCSMCWLFGSDTLHCQLVTLGQHSNLLAICGISIMCQVTEFGHFVVSVGQCGHVEYLLTSLGMQHLLISNQVPANLQMPRKTRSNNHSIHPSMFHPYTIHPSIHASAIRPFIHRSIHQ